MRYSTWERWSTLPGHQTQELARVILEVVASRPQAEDCVWTGPRDHCQSTGCGQSIGPSSFNITLADCLQIIALVAEQKSLEMTRRPKKNMFIEDVVEFARVLLTTTETAFLCGWQRMQLLLFCQLAAITANRPGALLGLRYRDLRLTLIRDPEGGRPRLFIFLTPEFTKRFLGKKAPWVSMISEA